MKSRVRNATKENARYVQHDARFIGVSEQPEPVAGGATSWGNESDVGGQRSDVSAKTRDTKKAGIRTRFSVAADQVGEAEGSRSA